MVTGAQRSYQLKVGACLGDDVKDEKTVVILNRKLVWMEDCIEHEADEQGVEKVWCESMSRMTMCHRDRGYTVGASSCVSGVQEHADSSFTPSVVPARGDQQFRSLGNADAGQDPLHPKSSSSSCALSLQNFDVWLTPACVTFAFFCTPVVVAMFVVEANATLVTKKRWIALGVPAQGPLSNSTSTCCFKTFFTTSFSVQHHFLQL